ncbi:MAG: multicopper oxidase domain-containing protein [Rhizobiales bacterium]|nr:multicopper oxidase domain-containing protein [Hyphomicrobiales bacterium]
MAGIDEPARMTRRRFLRDAAAGGALLGTAGLVGGAAGGMAMEAPHHPPTPKGVPRAPYDPGAALVEPELRRSVEGVLETRLRVAYAWRDIGGYRLSMRSYEGGSPGPTLRLRPGDTLRIRLVNDLPPNPDPMPADMTLPHQFNTTNFHFHGGHVSPGALADNIFREMEPGGAYDIVIAVPPDHPGGTFWYHPHRHGAADIQITSGMMGALVVEGDFAGVPEIAAAAERVLIVAEMLFDHRGAIESYDTVWPEAVPRFLSVNGQRAPVMRMRPGEVQRWRIVQAAHEDNLALALAGHRLNVIAFDGIERGGMLPLDRLVLAPGQRADVLVKAGAPGDYLLEAVANDQGYPSPTGPIARLVVEGEPLAMALPAALGPAPYAAIDAAEVTNRRHIWLSSIEPEKPEAAGYQEFTFLVCDTAFSPDRVDHRIPLGAVEEWLVENRDAADHVFHIHTNPFQLVAVDGAAVTPEWHDTVVVPARGSITFRTRFLDFTGRFVLHCHMMNHEELGMMQVIEVYAP